MLQKISDHFCIILCSKLPIPVWFLVNFFINCKGIICVLKNTRSDLNIIEKSYTVEPYTGAMTIFCNIFPMGGSHLYGKREVYLRGGKFDVSVRVMNATLWCCCNGPSRSEIMFCLPNVTFVNECASVEENMS